MEKWQKVCISPNIIRVVKSRRKRWVGHVANMRDKCIQNLAQKNLREETTQNT
jgi:hypothetical protein